MDEAKELVQADGAAAERGSTAFGIPLFHAVKRQEAPEAVTAVFEKPKSRR